MIIWSKTRFKAQPLKHSGCLKVPILGKSLLLGSVPYEIIINSYLCNRIQNKKPCFNLIINLIDRCKGPNLGL